MTPGLTGAGDSEHRARTPQRADISIGAGITDRQGSTHMLGTPSPQALG